LQSILNDALDAAGIHRTLEVDGWIGPDTQKAAIMVKRAVAVEEGK
jgi:hypothetical protein